MKNSYKIGIAVLVSGILIFLVFFLFWNREDFSIEDVDFEISAPKMAEAGEPVDFIFVCKNKSKKDLQNVKLSLKHPLGIFDVKTAAFLGNSFDFSNVPSGGEAKKEFKLSLFGKKDEVKEIKAKAEFFPKDSEKSYFLEGRSETKISSVPLFLRFDMPAQAATGQEINFSFEYTSKSKYDFPNFAARAIYAPGFQFFSATPSPEEENNFWIFDALKSKEEGKVAIRGSTSGIKEENKQFRTELGIIDEGQFFPIFEEFGVFKIVETPLSIWQFVNNKSDYAARIGGLLNFVIKYKNNTKEKLREVFINMNLECRNSQDEIKECLNWKELNIVNGEFNGFTKTISWRASGAPELQELSPGEEGEVKFSIVVKEKLPITSEADKNFFIKSRAKIDMNPQYVPQSLKGFKIDNEIVSMTKINSWLTLVSRGYYNHPIIKNSGPVPPKVGETTTYTIVWELQNLVNDLKEVVVEGSLPTNVIWKNKFYPEDADIQFQSYTGKVIWKLGKVSANTGTILPKKEVAFQVAIQPSRDLIKRSVDLTENIQAEGIDVFTESRLKAANPKITTDIPDDPLYAGQGKVAP